MEDIQRRFLVRADSDGRFAAQPIEYIFIHNYMAKKTSYQVFNPDRCLKVDAGRNTAPNADNEQSWQGCLRCALQRKRPPHISGLPDPLPFPDALAAQKLWSQFDLPWCFFQIADGSPATAKAHICYDAQGRPERFELVANCLTKQGHWAMALSHTAVASCSSVFWNMDDRIDAERMMENLRTLQDYASHPVLTPCIMFAETFNMALERRHSIKARLERLEDALMKMSDQTRKLENDDSDTDLERLFLLVQSCRKDQASRKGRYNSWYTFHGAIQEGFRYTDAILQSKPDPGNFKQNADLRQWADMTWQRLQSLMARDKDHILRVENAATTLHNIVQQREIRLQSRIASAARRDSEDMKYIAVLGSVFLPAGLVASILNVPEFQFLPGAKLFGAYIAITVPMIALVVAMCLSRPYWTQWRLKGSEAPGLPCATSAMSEKWIGRSNSQIA